MDEVTILTALNNNKLVKTFIKIKGKIIKSDYDKAYQFSYQNYPFQNILDLSDLLTVLEQEQNRCIIRGELIPGVDPRAEVLRRKDAYDGKEAYFQEAMTGHHWACFDFDHTPAIEGLTDNRLRLEYLVYLLGPEFDNVSFHFQWSSSAGLEGWDDLNCHLWFWLDKKHTDTELQRWAIAHGEVDDAPFRTVQPNYTGEPVFKNFDDPIKQRSGYIQRKKQEAHIQVPALTEQRYTASKSGYMGSGTGSFADKLKQIGPRYHMPIQQAICNYVGANGTKTNLIYLKQKIVEAVRAGIPGRTPKQTYLNDRYLDQCINSAMRKYGNHTPSDNSLLRQKFKNWNKGK